MAWSHRLGTWVLQVIDSRATHQYFASLIKNSFSYFQYRLHFIIKWKSQANTRWMLQTTKVASVLHCIVTDSFHDPIILILSSYGEFHIILCKVMQVSRSLWGLQVVRQHTLQFLMVGFWAWVGTPPSPVLKVRRRQIYYCYHKMYDCMETWTSPKTSVGHLTDFWSIIFRDITHCIASCESMWILGLSSWHNLALISTCCHKWQFISSTLLYLPFSAFTNLI